MDLGGTIWEGLQFSHAGYMVSKNIAVGALVQLFLQSGKGTSKNNNGLTLSASKSTQSTYGLTPYIRYYFKETSKSCFYGQINGGICMAFF